MVAIIRVRLLHVEDDAAEQGRVVVADVGALPVAEGGFGAGCDGAGLDDLRAVFVGDEGLREDEELQARADLGYVLGDGERGVGAEGAGGREGREGLLVAHQVPEAGVDAGADLRDFALQGGVEVADLDDLRLHALSVRDRSLEN